MGIRVRNNIRVRLPEGLYNGSDLRRWFNALDADDSLDGYRLRLLVMRAASHQLPVKLLTLDRIEPFTQEGMGDSRNPTGSPDAWPPVVVIGDLLAGPVGLADGRHRVTEARRLGLKAIRAVSIARPA